MLRNNNLVRSLPLLLLIPLVGGINYCPPVWAGPGKGLQDSGSVMRPEIKRLIDELCSFPILSVEHTTDSIPAPPKIRAPEAPKPFEAGRFKISFGKGDQLKALICQTEELVGHIATVVPGETNVGGYVRLLDDPRDDHSPGPQLNPTELDYFITCIYRKFSGPQADEEAILLNKTKDCALAIMFSGKPGIKEYHAEQINKIKGK